MIPIIAANGKLFLVLILKKGEGGKILFKYMDNYHQSSEIECEDYRHDI
jgi:hypothetical protein